jgi:hypothetical protein
MEAYGKVLLIAMPIFLVLIFLEAGIATMRGKQWDVIDSVAHAGIVACHRVLSYTFAVFKSI